MRKEFKPGHRYFIVNIDEPYAREIFEVLKRGQIYTTEDKDGTVGLVLTAHY